MEAVLVSPEVHSNEREMIENALKEYRVEVRNVNSYKKAIEDLAKYKCRMVILYCFESRDDLKITETVKIMRELLPDLLIIAISEETPLDTERELRKSGIYYHISSPIDEQELKEVLAGAIIKNLKRNIK